MNAKAIYLLSGLLLIATEGARVRKFPDGFQFGTSTSAFQVEGAWNTSGKSESIWDHAVHTPGKILDGSHADVSADSYHNLHADVEILKHLGAQFYRFSISWPRLLPNGFSNKINPEAVEYYNRLIDQLIENDITPFITIFHFDLPQSLQELGGFANPASVDWFEDFSRVVFDLFADRVKMWLTINEPVCVCAFSYYSSGFGSPLINPNPYGTFLCTKNIMLANARAWRLYDNEYRPKHGGYIGYSNLLTWFEPASDSQEDIELAELANQFNTGLYSHPVFSKEGGWPSSVVKTMEEVSRREGYVRSKLPAFTPEEVDYVKGTSDYYGIQHYFTKLVNRNDTPGNTRPFVKEIGINMFDSKDWQQAPDIPFKLNPIGMRRVLKYIKEQYNNPWIILTENGYPTKKGLEDDLRIQGIRAFLDQVLDAITIDKVNVTHYGYWSLMDNFEWTSGYTVRMGLYEVDFEDPARTRTARKSALEYKHIAQTKTLDFNYEPKLLNTKEEL